MGTHPNTILMCVLTPDDLARKTFRDIAEEMGAKIDDDSCTLRILNEFYDHPNAKTGEPIPKTDFTMTIMESDYDDSFQLSAPAGSIVLHDFQTYGYGEVITWTKLEDRKNKLETWAKDICERHKCKYEIQVTANYW